MAADLWRTTGESSYNKYFLDNYAKYLPDLRAPKAESWKEVAPMGLWAYALAPRPGGTAQRAPQFDRERSAPPTRLWTARAATRTRKPDRNRLLVGVGAAEKGLQFALESAPDLPRFVAVDAGKLRQVLLNLVGNAIKFTDSGGVKLRAGSPAANEPKKPKYDLRSRIPGPA